MQQEIRFCTSPDGVRIAYAKSGSGPPIVRVGTFLTHLKYDWESPIWRPWLDNFSRFNTLYRYDARGCGLSDWDVDDFSIESLLSDIETVVNAAKLDRLVLMGMSQGASAAIWYAAHHPERVSHVIALGGFIGSGTDTKKDALAKEEAEVREKLLKLAWATDNPAYHQVFTTELLPDGTPEQIKWLNDLQRMSSTGENAVRLNRGYGDINVLQDASRLSVPTLILHSRDDKCVTFEHGRTLAALIPDALFIPLDSKNHILLPSEPAWGQFWHHVYDFLGLPEAMYRNQLRQESTLSTVARFSDLTLREREVLHFLAQGLRNDEIASHLVLSGKTIRNYVSHIFSKLDVSSRGEAIVLAKEGGFGDNPAQ